MNENPKAIIQIAVMQDGRIEYGTNCDSRGQFLMMIEMAKVDIERQMFAVEQQKVKVPEGGIEIPNLRG